MSRPDYPNCVMTPEVIRGVQERQRVYDSDPNGYERREREQEEQYWQDERERMEHMRQEED